MNDFTASNGYVVRVDPREDAHYPLTVTSLGLIRPSVDALREFFQAEADDRLGRWRWPENPDYVAIPRERTDTPREKRRVRVIHEPSGDFMDTVEGSSLVGVFKDAARAFFDAHPEPKPWHDAADGEVWELTGAGGLEQPWRRLNGRWVSFSGEIKYDAVHAIAGRRIWPEVSA